jgi:lipid-binding SYLF domain-containing protein
MNRIYTLQLLGRIIAFSAFLVIGMTSAQAASKVEIDARVAAALAEFSENSRAGANLMQRAAGALVFPRVIKGGIGIGGEYGEGALLVGGQTVEYYSTAAASIGFQLGGQVKTQLILFMTQESLDNFRNSDGWEAGVDGSVAIAEFGAGGDLDTKTIKSPIIGFVFSNKGLMYNLTLEGSKITKLVR